MPESKSRINGKGKNRFLKLADRAESRRAQAQELLNEIDNLALLLHEVKKQTDKIEAAADAIGDTILARLDIDGMPRSPLPGRSPISMPAKATARLRSLPARAAQTHIARPLSSAKVPS